MYVNQAVSALVAVFSLSVSALPQKGPLNLRVPGTSTNLSRLNPTYTKAQLNQIKLATTQIERLEIIRSFGDTNDFFKFDFTPAGFESNAGNGQGGQGFLAAVQNYPVLMGTGLSMAIGFLNPC